MPPCYPAPPFGPRRIGSIRAGNVAGGAKLSTAAQQSRSEAAFELALLSDAGTDRANNEDSCGHWIESPVSAVFAVADGIGGYEGGEIASAMAVEITLAAYRDSPASWGLAK